MDKIERAIALPAVQTAVSRPFLAAPTGFEPVSPP
jgi:hypothetical protein